MAFLAGERRVLIVGRAMTVLAGNRRVLADEREAGPVVIEGDVLAPVDVVVTLLAALAELPLVRILLLMTGDARYRQFVTIDIAGVTSVTLDFHMRAAKWKLGLPMIEIRFFPFALIVTGLAFDAIALGVNILQTVT